MLNLPIVMLKISLVLSLIFFMQSADASITSPQPGDVLRGQVNIIGNMNVPNFVSAELAFSYAASDSADTWFIIQTFPQPVQDPTMAIWDTTSLTDGDYIFRLRVTLQDGTFQDVVISDLKIRNDVPFPTETPTATLTPEFADPLPISAPVEISTVQPVTTIPTFPSSTPLPANPASVTISSIYGTFARGGLITLVLFIIFSLLLRLRKS